MLDALLLQPRLHLHCMADPFNGEHPLLHTLNVTLLALVLARALRLPIDTLCAVGLGALFHDTARQATASGPRHSQAAIDFQHCRRGRALCAALELPEMAMQVIAQHHERFDGSGHPKGLRATQISSAAQVVALADHYDELCNPEDPALALSPHEALAVMCGPQRHTFNPAALSAFARCLGVHPPGTVVSLSNGMIGSVAAVDSNGAHPPTLRIYNTAAPAQLLKLPIELARRPGLTITSALRPEQLTAAARRCLVPSQRLSYQLSTGPAAV